MCAGAVPRGSQRLASIMLHLSIFSPLSHSPPSFFSFCVLLSSCPASPPALPLFLPCYSNLEHKDIRESGRASRRNRERAKTGSLSCCKWRSVPEAWLFKLLIQSLSSRQGLSTQGERERASPAGLRGRTTWLSFLSSSSSFPPAFQAFQRSEHLLSNREVFQRCHS